MPQSNPGLPEANSTAVHHNPDATIPYQQPDESIDISRVSFIVPEHHQEDSIEDSVITNASNTEESVITFTVVDGGTQRAKRKLVSSDGFTFVIKGLGFMEILFDLL